MLGMARLRKLVRFATSPVRLREGHALVLVYHRVCEIESDPCRIAVTPDHFADHLSVLRENYHPLSLRALGQAIREKQVPKNAVVVTLDDGYVDNLFHAKPVCERFSVPATVFITTGKIGKMEFWWDELEKVVLGAYALPERFVLEVGGGQREWLLDPISRESPVDTKQGRGWTVNLETRPRTRERMYMELSEILGGMGDTERESCLAALLEWSRQPCRLRPDRRTLTAEEIVQLTEGGIIDVGAHSVTHPLLALQSPEAQAVEIGESKRELENIVGHTIASFAYPHGGRGDYATESVCAVREAGFEQACTAIPGVVNARSDLFQLPRLMVMDWDGERFARQIRSWFRS